MSNCPCSSTSDLRAVCPPWNDNFHECSQKERYIYNMVKNNSKIAEELADHTYCRMDALRAIMPKYFQLDGLTLHAWKINWRQICDWMCEDEELETTSTETDYDDELSSCEFD